MSLSDRPKFIPIMRRNDTKINGDVQFNYKWEKLELSRGETTNDFTVS